MQTLVGFSPGTQLTVKHKAKDVTKKDILTILDKVVGRNAPIAANRTLAVVRRMFNFAVERDILSMTPCYGIKMPSKEDERDCVLSLGETTGIRKKSIVCLGYFFTFFRSFFKVIYRLLIKLS